MSSRLALFPLKAVVFPGEKLPLHIFEDRYKELIRDCEATGMHFGIPAYINNRLRYGTEMKLEKVMRRHSSGACDIICRGLSVFRILEFDHHEKDKMYSAGNVEYPANEEDSEAGKKRKLFKLVSELYFHLELPPPQIDLQNFRSYTLAHKMGLSLEQEYNLLKIPSEAKREDFLINHLSITIPIIQEMNRTKQTIELNGHFRNYDPLDFKEFRLRKK